MAAMPTHPGDAGRVHHPPPQGGLRALQVAIVGDILHSRVARSLIHALNILGAGEMRVIAPRTLLPAGWRRLGVHPCHDPRAGLRDVDVVVMLRLQRERMEGALLPSEAGIFPALRFDRGTAGAGQAGRHRHAPRHRSIAGWKSTRGSPTGRSR
jgi:hypothetical protein